jgi:phage gpG-like protein
MTAHVGTNVEYAAYVEYGTSRHPEPNPPPIGYLRRALDENRATCRRLYADELSKGLQSGK